jgi:hypothetical protein
MRADARLHRLHRGNVSQLAGLVVVAILAIVSCTPVARPVAPPSPPPPTASRAAAAAALDGDVVATSLRASGLPALDIRVFNAETDPERLLGRPGQYSDKVAWRDARGDEATLELFPNLASLQARKVLIDSRNMRDGIQLQYIYDRPSRHALLRLSRALTSDQARAYEDWFNKL